MTEISAPLRPLDNSSNILFRFDASTVHETDMNQLYMNVALSLRKPDGGRVEHRKNLEDSHYLNRDTVNFAATADTDPGAPGADATLSCANNLLHSIFDSCQLKIKGQVVERVTQYKYIAYINSLLGFTETTKENVLPSTIGWISDQEEKFDESSNEAFQKRIRYLLLNGKTVYLKGKLELGCCNLDRRLPTNLPVELEFRRTPNEFALVDTRTGTVPAYTIKIEDINLQVKRVALSPGELRVQEEQLKKGGIAYRFMKTECRSYVATSGHPQFDLNDLESGKLPDRVILGMVDTTAFHGTYGSNPFHLKSFDLSEAWLTVNGGDKIPGPVGYTFDLANRKSLDGYMELLETGNQHALKMKQYLGGSALQTPRWICP